MQSPKDRCTRFRPRPWLALLATVLLAGGCSSTLDIPRADNDPATGQKKARAVHHWDVLADDVAARIADKISEWPAGQHPIYVSHSGESSFNQGFRKLLITRLLDRGVALSTEPTAVELAFETQLVQYPAPVSNTLTLLVTTSLESGSRYLARTADVYYIAQDDALLYQVKEPPPPPARVWKVVAP